MTGTTEDEMIASIKRVVRRRGCKVPDPDYRATRMYAPQWKAKGAINYYQLPNDGKVIAKFYPGVGPYHFNRNGFNV